MNNAPKETLNQIRQELNTIISSKLLSNFTYYNSLPKESGQFWSLELFAYEEADVNLDNVLEINLGYFKNDSYTNPNLDINVFFENNDKLVNEFFQCYNYSCFNGLIAPLVDLSNWNLSASIVLNSFIVGGDDWLRSVCNESVLILHPDDNSFHELYLGVQQSERKFIKIDESYKIKKYKIPFDKCSYFKDYELIDKITSGKSYPYEIALSFAGEDRKYVNSVANQLKRLGIRLFYDDYEKVSLWGKDLYSHLDDVYKNKSRYCIMFISKHYGSKLWTNHERQSAQERAFKENIEYILPVKIDDTVIPGIRETVGYLDANHFSPFQIAKLAKEKIDSYSI
jgi:hypothetical protein